MSEESLQLGIIKELRDMIREIVVHEIKEKYSQQFRDNKYRYEEIIEFKRSLESRMTNIQKSIHDHAIGVQNVYAEFTKAMDHKGLMDWSRKHAELQDLIDKLNKRMEEIQKTVNKCHTDMWILKDTYGLRNKDPFLLRKIKDIMDVMEGDK